ncbi:uncharacterized protein PAC_16172 [Phialocephala subalpina]|uniref:Uncharacterized protein n=1 Tax=Phialocephala subalpina TaxID=576137 RepID=A0A1L7XMJ1_9HELO|nr:uncharacterized protein PAC_16172 [Phialocephala subalpina]
MIRRQQDHWFEVGEVPRGPRTSTLQHLQTVEGSLGDMGWPLSKHKTTIDSILDPSSFSQISSPPQLVWGGDDPQASGLFSMGWSQRGTRGLVPSRHRRQATAAKMVGASWAPNSGGWSTAASLGRSAGHFSSLDVPLGGVVAAPPWSSEEGLVPFLGRGGAGGRYTLCKICVPKAQAFRYHELVPSNSGSFPDLAPVDPRHRSLVKDRGGGGPPCFQEKRERLSSLL